MIIVCLHIQCFEALSFFFYNTFTIWGFSTPEFKGVKNKEAVDGFDFVENTPSSETLNTFPLIDQKVWGGFVALVVWSN